MAQRLSGSDNPGNGSAATRDQDSGEFDAIRIEDPVEPGLELLNDATSDASQVSSAGLIINEISLDGLTFESTQPFRTGAVHRFRLTMGDGSCVELDGRVQRCACGASASRPRYVCGIEFIEEGARGADAAAGNRFRSLARARYRPQDEPAPPPPSVYND